MAWRYGRVLMLGALGVLPTLRVIASPAPTGALKPGHARTTLQATFSRAMPAASLIALDEITERTEHLVVPLNHPVSFHKLIVTVRACLKRSFDDPPNEVAFLQIDRMPYPTEEQVPRRIFSGWMFTSSPSISALNDSVYDVMLMGCAAPAPDDGGRS